VRAAAILVVGLLLARASWAQPHEAANAFLESLDEKQADAAAFEFDNEDERKDWSNLPGGMHPRNGLTFGNMNDAQKIAAYRLLESSLSSQGYHKVTGVMRLDDIWRDAVNARMAGRGSAMFGSDKYWLALFGQPDADGPWGWQIDGHHLAVNFTSVDGENSLTPMFFGAEPETVLTGPYAGWRIFAKERAKAFALMNAFSPEQREKAVLSETIPPDIFEGPAKGGALDEMEGIQASELDEEQRKLLWSLIDEYLNNAPAEVAQKHRDKILADGDETLWFAWMGPVDGQENIYFRVHGPSVLIEYDNVFAGPADRSQYSNHMHTIIRDPGSDFGEDLLRKHYAESEHHRKHVAGIDHEH
jgi:hypothetical protein